MIIYWKFVNKKIRQVQAGKEEMKMDKATRVFLACASGAGIGTLVALQLGNFWGLGALLGGLVGYLIYDLEEVIKAIPVAWNTVLEWRPDKESLSKIGLIIVFFVCVLLTLIVSPLFLTAMIMGTSEHSLLMPIGLYGWLMSVYYFFSKSKEPRLRNINEEFLCLLGFNPFTIYIYYPVKGIAWAVPRIPSGLMILARFVKTVFVLIHSDLRLLCGIDSLIGAAVGYFTGNVLVGALTGGVLGVVNYEIVSKKILKVELRP